MNQVIRAVALINHTHLHKATLSYCGQLYDRIPVNKQKWAALTRSWAILTQINAIVILRPSYIT